MSTRTVRIVIAALVLFALVASGVAYRLNRDLEETRARVQNLERELERERSSDAADDETPAASEDLGALDDVLSDLLEGSGESGGLLEGLGSDLLSCVGLDALGSSDLGDLFEDGGDDRPRGVRAVARAVEKVRDLRFTRPVRASFLGPRETARRLMRLLFESYPRARAAADARILSALGAVPPRTDLRAVARKLATSQVAGFYVPETKQLVVKRSRARPGPLEELTLAHELEHALADQALGLPVDDDLEAGEEDSDLAALSLVEGDATLTMQRYALANLPLTEQLGLSADPSVAAAEDALADVPHFLRRQLLFPYTEGLSFVCDLYARGGWDAVDRAYERPPRSTVEVLFPRRYRRDSQPVDVAPPSREGWRVAAERAFGAANLLWLFEAPGGDAGRALSNADERIADWAGGAAWWLRGPSGTAVAVAFADRPGARTLCPSVVEWYDAAFDDDRRSRAGDARIAFDGPDQDAVVACSAGEVRLGIADDVEVARTLAS